jgi:glycosyltransferase involved in cell wall biosynthesis
MIIGIDGNEANVQKRVGIGEYAYELLRNFSLSNSTTQDLKFIIYLKDKPLVHMPKGSDNWKYRILKPGKLWTQWRLPIDLYMNNPKPDVFFTPSHYAPRFSPVPTVISVMDLAYIYFPKLFNNKDLHQLSKWTSYSVKNAKKILTISKSSKNDIIKEYKVPSSKVVVTYPGIKDTDTLEPNIYGMNQIKAKYNLSDKYVLFVGTLQPRKNITKLIEAFSLISGKEDLQLVIVGRKGWMFEEILSAPQKYSVENKIKFLENINNEELRILYKHALCLVLPSLYEGFGLPVLEAMQEGCPVIASNVSSLPEAGGDACLYINPNNSSDIAEKIEKLIGNEKLRQDLIKKGKIQVAKFNWEKTARETLKVLEEVGGKI